MPLAKMALPFVALTLTLSCTDDKPTPDPTDDAQQVATPSGAATAKPKITGPKAAADGTRVFFKFPQHNSKVFSPVALSFGLEGKQISPAGQNMEDQSKGHHHIVIDGETVAAGSAVPADDTHVHFGKGQTNVELPLAPGKHTLTMQFADGAHLSFGPALASSIEVEVVESTGARKVKFLEPADAAKVKSPVKLKFGLEGMKIRPAGQDPLDKTTGHHHLIIDGKPIALGNAVPADEKNIHYGKGQTEAEVKLSPGKHTLTMQLADGAHLSYGPALSATISVEVVP